VGHRGQRGPSGDDQGGRTPTDPSYFISHVDLTRIAQYPAEAARLTGEALIAMMFRHLSTRQDVRKHEAISMTPRQPAPHHPVRIVSLA
jgi:hypothetical protein